MECRHCKSSWKSLSAVTNCPFCGKRILNNTEDNMTLPDGISTIVSEYGIEILNDSKRAISLIMDYVRGYDREKKLFRIVCNCGILKNFADIKASPESQRDLLIKKAIKKLEDEVFFSTENAEYIISLILNGLGISYSDRKEERPDPQILTSTQSSNIEVVTKPVGNNAPASVTGDEERLKNIALSDAAFEKDKESHLWSIVNENRRPTNDESIAILNLGRKLLKNGNTTNGIKLIKFVVQYGYPYGALLLGYCYDKGIGVPMDYNIATAYYQKAGVSGGADEIYKFHGWSDSTHRTRAYTVAEKIYNEKL